MRRQRCIVALGANVGVPRRTLGLAVRRLGRHRGVRLQRQSGWYTNPAWPLGTGPDFVNGIAMLETRHCPMATLDLLRKVEGGLGRRRVRRDGPRLIDLDLIAHDHCVQPRGCGWRLLMRRSAAGRRVRTPLVLPHPEMHRRAFVLVPLCELETRWRHPVLGITSRKMRQRLEPQYSNAVVRLD